jgi:hypothetical protein
MQRYSRPVDDRWFAPPRVSPTQRAPPPERSYPAEKARGGEIILNAPLKRGLLVAGLAGVVALALVLSFAREAKTAMRAEKPPALGMA